MNVANPTIYLLACTDRKYPHGEDFIAMYIDSSVQNKDKCQYIICLFMYFSYNNRCKI